MLLLAVCCIQTEATAKDEDFKAPHISVTGSASGSWKPDSASLWLGVTTENKLASEASKSNGRIASELIAQLKEDKIEPADIQTERIALAPFYTEERDPQTKAVTKRTFTGYRAANDIRVRIRDVDRAGAIVSRILVTGVTYYRGLIFEISSEAEHMDMLRAKAIQNARHRAEIYARAAGVRLGRLMAIDPSPSDDGAADLPTRRFQPTAVVEVPISPGTVKLNATVTATWELVPE